METAKLLLPLALCAAIAGLVTSCAFGTLRSKPGTTTTLILLRHGDRDAGAEELNAKGRERARALVEVLSGIRVTAIYSPDVKRNRDTVRPLAEKLGIDITVKSSESVSMVREMVEEILSKHAGGAVVYVGNVSGNLQTIYGYLGAPGNPPEEYGELFLLTVPDGGAIEVDRRRFGP